MITIISGLLGFLGSIVPELFKEWRDKKDKKHEIAMMELQIKNSQLINDGKIKEIEATANLEDVKAVNNRAFSTSSGFGNILNSIVRPLLTMSFFVLYGGVKYLQYTSLVDAGLSDKIFEVWTETDTAIFTAIISYWFGHRSFKKMRS